MIHFWTYVWKRSAAQGLNKGRIISPDATLKTIFPVASSACAGARGEKRMSELGRGGLQPALRSHCKDQILHSWRTLMWRFDTLTCFAMWVTASTVMMRYTRVGLTC